MKNRPKEDDNYVEIDVYEIINEGQNITVHYLDKDNIEFQIFRYNQNIYAISYENSIPRDFVYMWKSHKKVDKNEPELLDDRVENKVYKKIGSGAEGKVYEKTEDKVFKTSKKHFNVDKMTKGEAFKNNIQILRQKFFLKENNISQNFVLGLWNVKDEENIVFYMPKIKKSQLKDRIKRKIMYEILVINIKKLNELNYFHPDLFDWEESFFNEGNIMMAEDRVNLVDIDKGFFKIDSKETQLHKDQWIWVYNAAYPPLSNWTEKLDQWYKENSGKTLSENPLILQEMYEKDNISLPSDITKNLIEKEINIKIEDQKNDTEYKEILTRELIKELNQYVSSHQEDNSITLFFSRSGKGGTANRIVKILEKEEIELSDRDFQRVRDGELFEILAREKYRNILPLTIKRVIDDQVFKTIINRFSR